jgi:hypothetical protein
MVPSAIGMNALVKSNRKTRRRNSEWDQNFPRNLEVSHRWRNARDALGNPPQTMTAPTHPANARTGASYGNAKNPRIIATTKSPWNKTLSLVDNHVRERVRGKVSSDRKMGIVMLKIA